MKIWMIQNIIAPYRIKLFEEIAKNNGLDFRVLLTARGIKSLPQWDFSPTNLPFPAEHVPGLCFQLKDDRLLCFNPTILFKMFLDRPDAIVCPGFSFVTLLAMIYRLLGRGRYIIWMEGTEYTEKDNFFVRNLRSFMATYASALVDAGTLSRRYLKSLLPKDSRKSFFTSYNCVETDRFVPEIANPGTLNKLKAKYPPQNILFVGRLIKIKGILQLLNAYRIVSERSPNPVGLVLVGQGPLEKEIREFKKKYQLNNIFLEGFVKYQKLPAYYWISDLLVNLGTEDRNPLVLFEALAAGIPILFSNRIGNAVDFVKDGENGYIVDPFDAEAITLKAIELLKWDSAKRERAAILSRNITKKANYHDSGKAFAEACRMALKSI